MIRRPFTNDISEFERIASSYPNNPLVTRFETAAVVDDNGIKGFGFTRAILEAVLYTDGSKRDKVISYNQLLEIAKKDAQKLGFDQLYAFVDPLFAKILTKRGWRIANDVCVVMDLDNGKQ